MLLSTGSCVFSHNKELVFSSVTQNSKTSQEWGEQVSCLTSSSPGDVEEALGCKCVANTLDITMQLTHEHKQLTKNKNTHTELATKKKTMKKKKILNSL